MRREGIPYNWGQDGTEQIQGIHSLMGHGSMAAVAADPGLETVHRRQGIAPAHGDLAGGAGRIDVECDDMVQLRHRLVLDHGCGAAGARFVETFLGRLKQQLDPALPRIRLGCVVLLEDLGGAQQHGRVGVVAAGMHDPGVVGLEGMFDLLLDGQRVHVRPNANDRPVGGPDGGGHPGPADLGPDVLRADFGQGVGHQGGGSELPGIPVPDSGGYPCGRQRPWTGFSWLPATWRTFQLKEWRSFSRAGGNA